MAGRQAYINLIHTLKLTSLKLITDLLDADEEKVLQSIRRTDGHHFKTGFTVHARTSTSRTHDPEFSTEHFDDTTNKLICELHIEAAQVCEKMSTIHTLIACLKTRVSAKDFLTIVNSVGLPLTTITTVDPEKQEKLDKGVDALRIRNHMPDPNNVVGNEAIKLLAALVRYWMQNYLLTTQWQYSLVACERDFNLGRTKFERVVSGKKQAGGYEYGKKRKIRPDEQPTGADKPKKKRENPVDRTQVKTGVGCKYCNKVCLNEETLSIHINNEHADKQRLFQCVFCGLRVNDFGLYNRHVKEHSDRTHKCYMCSEVFDNTRELRKHVNTHINQCPLCSRAFPSLLVLSDHVNNDHMEALQGDHKKCPFCDAAFNHFDELSTHCKEHRSYSCDICYTGFVSEPLLVEHRFNDHPEGRPAWSAPREDPDITFVKEVDPALERAMEVIRTPDPDMFVDKWHPAIGHLKKSDRHKVECEVCHRYLKTFKLQVEHVKTFHPTVSFDCIFCPDEVFYTCRDLLNHCKKNHCVCQQCDSVHKDQDALNQHTITVHPQEQPAQPDPEGTRKGHVCGKCGMYCSTATSFRVHLTTHKKTPCPFCPQKFFDVASRNKHIGIQHKDRGNRKLNCRLAPVCKQTFNNMKELGIHSRQAHWEMFPFRCSYKDCFDCYRTINALVKHCKMHGRETWDEATKERKVRYKCSMCGETFDLVAQLLSHTQVHEENKFKCDECDWHFSMIAALTLHGKDCHDTRKHACSWCVEYFNNAEQLYTHVRSKHNFECTICYSISYTAEELEEHSKEVHGGLQPTEQEIQAQRRGEERLECEGRRKQKTEAEARRTAYFPCKECVEGFNTRVELDRHTVNKHIFICGECLRTFKIKDERDAHMKTDHKETPTQMTRQEKLLIEEYRKRESREEKYRRAQENWEKAWTEYARKKSEQEAEDRQARRRPTATQTREQAERAEGDDRDEDEDYVPSEEPSSEDPTYEPTRKEFKRADKEGDQ